jgi:hypothetical protein
MAFFRSDKKNLNMTILFVLVSLMMCISSDAIAGMKKTKIDLQGLSTLAILPFTYSPLPKLIKTAGIISSSQFQNIFKEKSKLKFSEPDAVSTLVSEEKIDIKNPMSVDLAVELGIKLKAEAVLIGHLKSYDEKERVTEIEEGMGKGYIENSMEVRITYIIKIINVQTKAVIFEEEIKDSNQDRAKDPMKPASPDLLTERIARSVAKKLVKRIAE